MKDDFFGVIKNATDRDTRAWLKENDGKNLLLAELCHAEMMARKGGKRKTYDTHTFEVNLWENLVNLRDDLWDYSYKPSRGTAHIINKPVKREIFAAPYRDRIVHHWVVATMMEWWERRFIYDSYSCRKGKGTMFGIKRLAAQIRTVSQNYSVPTIVVKMDISGYFMHIDREKLYERVYWGLKQILANHKSKRFKMMHHAIREIIFDDPVDGVKIQGSYRDWRDLPADKSLFAQPPGRGIVIGNLTSQFFSNVFLDMLDRFIVFTLGYKYYGRYVDDFYIVVPATERAKVLRDIKRIEAFLNGLGLKMNPKKTRVIPMEHGVPFLGMVVRKGRIVPDKRIYNNFRAAAHEVAAGEKDINTIVSYMGMMKHYNGKQVINQVFDGVGWEYLF